MAGGTQVAVTGTNFYNVSSVNVGSATVSATCSGAPPYSDCYIVNSPTSITLYTPTGISAGGAGPGHVTVTNDVGNRIGQHLHVHEGSKHDDGLLFAEPVCLGPGGGLHCERHVRSHRERRVHDHSLARIGRDLQRGGHRRPFRPARRPARSRLDTLLAAGSTYAVSANYGGDGNYLTSTGTLSPVQTVNPSPTTTATPTSTVNPSVYGQPVTYSTTVSSAAPGAGIPTGYVVFEETVGGNTTTDVRRDTERLRRDELHVEPVASCRHRFGPRRRIWATPTTRPPRRAGSIQFVDQASTGTVLSSNLNPSGYGKPVTFTATVSAVTPGGGIPAGQVALLV